MSSWLLLEIAYSSVAAIVDVEDIRTHLSGMFHPFILQIIFHLFYSSAQSTTTIQVYTTIHFFLSASSSIGSTFFLEHAS